MNIEVLTEDSLLHSLKFLDWRTLSTVSEVSTLFQTLAEDSSLHRQKTLQVDVADAAMDVESLNFVFRVRDISNVEITDLTKATKKNPILRSLDVTRWLGRLSPIADNILDLKIKATVSESCLGLLQIFQNLQKLTIQDYFPVYDEFYDQKSKRPCLGYSDYCRMRDTWSLEALTCLELEGRSWTLMGSLLRKTNKGLFRVLCCYHTDKRDLRVKNNYGGDVREKCGGCRMCPDN